MKKIILMLSILLITNSYSWRVSKEDVGRFTDEFGMDNTVDSRDTTTDGDVIVINKTYMIDTADGYTAVITGLVDRHYYIRDSLTKSVVYFVHDYRYGFRDSLILSIVRIQDDGIHESSVSFRYDETVRSESYKLASGEIDESYYELRYYSDGNLLQRTDTRTDGSGATRHLVMVKTLYSKSGRVVGLYKYIKNDVGKYVIRDYRVTPPIGDFDIQYSATFTGNEKNENPVYVMSKYRDDDELKVEAYTMEEGYAGKYSINNVSTMLREFYNEEEE